jgi:ADP-ribose pyrophosphatase YjhB (NUDIX family)
MQKLFQHSKENPFHVSVGAVLYNERGEILVHKLLRETVPARERDYLRIMGDLDEAYHFMRESIENDESIEEAIARGLQEEFGATGIITRYLGSTQVVVPIPGREWEKTTLYCAVALETQGDRPSDDGESFSELVWVTPQFLLEKMMLQAAPEHPTHLNDLKILETFLQYYGK